MFLSKHLRDIRLGVVRRYVKGDVLDLGCGDAEILRLCRRSISCYCGVDINRDCIEANQVKYPGADFFIRDLDEDSIVPGRTFDCILLVALIEHIFNQKHLVKQAMKCLKPEGRMVITTPTPFGNDVVHRLGTALGLFHSHAANDHVVIYNQKRLQLLANEVGLKVSTYKTFELGCNQLAVFQHDIG